MDTHHGYDYHAMMNSNITDFSTLISRGVTTLAGGAVSLNVT